MSGGEEVQMHDFQIPILNDVLDVLRREAVVDQEKDDPCISIS